MTEAWKVQGSPEWLDFRKSRIGASDSATILGVNPWKSSLMLYEEKVLGTEFSKTPAMQRGNDLEDEARQAYQNEVGIFVFPDVFIHPKYDWMIASIDGYSEDVRRACELKCPGEKSFLKIQKSGTPIYYKVQMIHQMLVLRITKIDFFCYHPKLGTYYMPYHYEIDLGLKVMRANKHFYQCMINKTPELLAA